MKQNLAALVFMLLAVVSALADVPPDPGRTYVTESLKVEVEENLSDYRLFIQSPMDVMPISVTKDSPFRQASGGGGAKNNLRLIAIPAKSFAAFEGKPLSELSEALNTKKVDGVIDLANHNFRKEVPESKGSGTFEKTIVIVRTPNGLDTMIGFNESVSADRSGIGTGDVFLRNVLAGVLLAAVIAVIGLWWLTRKKKV
jgi:hypothetical protein